MSSFDNSSGTRSISSLSRWCLIGESVVGMSVGEEGPDEMTSEAGG